MWHEARKQEKKLRGIMVDYKRRAERRREFYEKIVKLYVAILIYLKIFTLLLLLFLNYLLIFSLISES